MGHKKRKWKREWERETKIMQLKIRLLGTRKPQNRGQTDGPRDRRMETATDQRSCHTKRHLPWSRCWDRIWTEKLHERKPKQLCVIELWFLLIRFCYRISFAVRSSSLSQEAKNRVNERSSDRLRHRHVWGPRRNDPHSQLTNRRPSRGTDGQNYGQTGGQTCGQTVTARPPHMCDESAAQSQSQRSQLCFSFSSFFCQLMIFIEFSRGKKFAKFAAKCSLLAAPQQIIKRADDRETVEYEFFRG